MDVFQGIQFPGEQHLSFDVGQLPSGLYVVSVLRDGNRWQSHKLFIGN
jgi:hypothetical protein